MQRCVCEVCGAGGASPLASLPCNCSVCGGQKTMKRAINSMLLPFGHEYFDKECGCEQCYRWFRQPGTVTQCPVRGYGHDAVQLMDNSGPEAHDRLGDFLVALGPAKLYYITGLIHTYETLTYKAWADRIRVMGAKAEPRPSTPTPWLTPESIEALAKGVEALGD